jgi:peptide/nickel transport system ATP-binding protein
MGMSAENRTPAIESSNSDVSRAPLHTDPADAPSIVLENVTRVYPGTASLFARRSAGTTALCGLNLAIDSGEIFGLVGESGSGKSTAARVIVRLEKADEGTVRYKGQDIAALRGSRLKRFRREVQMIFQDPYHSLNPYQSIGSIVAEPLHIHRWRTRASRQEKIQEALAQVGLTPPGDFLARHPHQLSGGQRQRVAIARAMVMDPHVLIADELTSMLDATIASQIYAILSEIQKRRGLTMLFITHNLAAAHYLCDRIGVMYRGYLMEIGPADEIIERPCHPYTQALLDALPRFGHARPERQFATLRKTRRMDPNLGGCPFFDRCVPADPDHCNRDHPPMRIVGERHYVSCFGYTSGAGSQPNEGMVLPTSGK